jgi:large subunit ribosomal protein L18
MKSILKRKKQGKTDYATRMNLLKSKTPRLVIRKSNRFIIAQIVESKEAQDKTISYANSKELSKEGWTFSFKNVPAAYLTGILIAEKAKSKGIKKAILDLSRYTSSKASKLYAVAKGAIDNGLEINCDEKVFPSQNRIYGEHTKNSEKIKKIIEKLTK